jgi:hypothetical protein
MELKIIISSEIGHTQKKNTEYFLSYGVPTFKKKKDMTVQEEGNQKEGEGNML